MKKRYSLFLFIFILFLSSCSLKQKNLSSKDVMDKMNTAQDQVKNVKIGVELQPVEQDIAIKGTSFYDFENKRYLQEIGKDDRMYEDADGFISAYKHIQLKSSEELYHDYFRDQVQYESNPLQYWSHIDEEIIDHFDLEEKEHTYILRYDGTEQERDTLLNDWIKEERKLEKKRKAFVNWSGDETFVARQFDIEFHIDPKTFRLKRYHEAIEYEEDQQREAERFNREVNLLYQDYNKLEKVSKPEIEEQR